jgi:hypothetical protein
MNVFLSYFQDPAVIILVAHGNYVLLGRQVSILL